MNILSDPRDWIGGQPRPSRMRNYLEGVASGLFAKCVPVIVGFWLTPFVLSRVGREAFGLYALATSVIAWLALLDMGLTPGLKAYLARHSASNNAVATSRYVSSTFFPQLGVALLVLSGGALIAGAVPGLLNVPGYLAGPAAWLTFLLAASTAVSLATQSFDAVLVSHQHLKRDNAARLILVGVRAVVIVALLWRGYSLVSLGVAHFVGVLISSAFSVISTYRLTPGLRVRPALVSRRELKLVSGCGIWFSIGAAAGLLVSGSDRIVAGKLVSLEAVTILSVTASAYLFAEATLSQIVNNARPALGQLFGENRTAALRDTYRRLLLGATGLGVVAATSIWAANEVFVGAWVGSRHYGGALLDLLLALNCVLALAILPSRALLAAHLTVRPQTLSRLAEGALNLILSIALTYSFGLVGTILSTSLAALATSFWYLPRLAMGVLGCNRSWILEVARKLAVFTALLLPGAWVGRAFASHTWFAVPSRFEEFGRAATGASFTAVVGFCLLWGLLLDAPMKKRLLEYTGAILQSVRLRNKRAAAIIGGARYAG